MNKKDYKQEGYEEFKAPAKINLFLKIIGKRDDGFHKLQSVFQLIDLYDYIYIRIRSDTQINLINASIEVDNQDDLGLKAARLILKDKNIGVDIYIKKNIPIGAGLGGGSSDAATILMGINKLANINLTKKELMTLGGAPATAFQGKNSVDILTQSATKITTPTKITHPPQSNTTT